MGKALMVAGSLNALGSGNEVNLFGCINFSAAEANTQASATEACTFSKLGINIISGGSGTNSLRFRDAGVNGNQLAEIAGTGVVEDAVNTDALTAGDLFNLAYTDTGTNSGFSWIKSNVEFTTGHGCFTGVAAFAGLVFDIASATRFIGLSGTLEIDGNDVEAEVAFKARGYDTFEALQVRVIANARTNDSVFRNRINGADGTGVITFAAAATGLVTATGLADAITDGHTINASITLGTGVEDLTVTFVAATLKSSASKQDTWTADNFGGLVRAASATAHYFTLGGVLPTLTAYTEAQARIKPGFAGIASNLRCYLDTNTYTVNATLKLFQNGVDVMTTTITAAGGAAWYENTADTVTFDDNDEFSFEIIGGTSGSITIDMIGMTFAPAAAGGGATQVRFGSILDGIGSQNIFLGNRLQ